MTDHRTTTGTAATDIDTAVAAIDKANTDDPNLHHGEPLALVQGQSAEAWAVRLDPHASEALRLAARAHHLRRWTVPRSTYPEGREGYLRWRRHQKSRHANELTELLNSCDIVPAIVERAALIVAKRGLGRDPEVQTFEDAVSLTFIETQFVPTADKLGNDKKMVEVVAKTLRKMSPAGQAAAHTIILDDRSAGIMTRALNLTDP